MSDVLGSPTLASGQVAPLPSDATPLDPFAPPGVDWQGVSPRLITVRLLSLAIGLGPVVIAGIVLSIIFPQWWFIVATIAATVLFVWQAVLIPRRVRAMAYAIRDRDFFLRSGLMFRRLSVVPYVRIQYVDVNVGPLLRAFHLASLTVNTASPTVSATLVGIPPDTAASIREVLTDRKNLVGSAAEDSAASIPQPDGLPGAVS